MTADPAWTTGTSPNSFAALPSGLLGRFGGWLMARTNRVQQDEVLELARVAAGETVLEVGHGPGVLLHSLVASPAARVVGVDPSAAMRSAAARRNAAAVASGRLLVTAGSAAATGLADAAVDVALSVNTVAIWPDLDAGVAELARVVRPGGRVVLSWHGGLSPTRMARGLMLPEPQLARIAEALRTRFPAVDRLRTNHCEAFRALTTAPTT